jgi:murein DD-endopeptidase MepM/ murein hydrolase activator NlpD
MGWFDDLFGRTQPQGARPYVRPIRFVAARGAIARGVDPNAVSVFWQYRGHHGIDIVAPEGTTVHAVADGVVVADLNVAGYGRVLMIRHDMRTPVTSAYTHLLGGSTWPLNTAVRAQQQIGQVGRTVDGQDYAWVEVSPATQGTGPWPAVYGAYATRGAGAVSNGGVSPISPHLHLELWTGAHPQITQPSPAESAIGSSDHPFDPVPWLRQLGVALVGEPWAPPIGTPLALH